MTTTEKLRELGQSLWLDNITRDLLNRGTLKRYIDTLSLTGLTSNPTIFDQAIRNSTAYDEDIARAGPAARSTEDLFFSVALADLERAADLFQPAFARTDRVDGWVSLEVSPLLAHDTEGTVAAARDLHRRAGKPNLFIKIPGTPEGLPAIEASIFAGVPVNVMLLFSAEQYVGAADAYWRGIERRIAAGLDPAVASVASLFVSRWDVAVKDMAPTELRNRLGIAGARPQRLLWASTGTKDPAAADTLYIEALAAPFTINTMPEGTLKAFADHGRVGAALSPDGGDSDGVLVAFAEAGIDTAALATRLQDEGAASFVKSWNDLMDCVQSKSAAIRKAS